MNLVTAEKMLRVLEQSSPDHDSDDTYFIIERLLKSEVRKGEERTARLEAQRAFNEATREESLIAAGGNLVRAIKMYRERTGMGLYDSKKAVEAGRDRLNLEEASKGITSCG